ncbi:hypothetical protein CAEBREN_10281 [Caenorhabditis brenneri]|uniref:Uncharacterized protein n=1 Tax=Caenorhabditis brenneri TaxID=135651 RepID=G0P7P6_CAEBE|nr:hypothetical protein CAEBREN_10281 [Caenorhabditis brenneri]
MCKGIMLKNLGEKREKSKRRLGDESIQKRPLCILLLRKKISQCWGQSMALVWPMNDTPYFFNKMNIKFRRKSIMIDGYDENYFSPRYLLDEIFKNQESKLNILQIDISLLFSVHTTYDFCRVFFCRVIDYFLSYHLFVNAKKLILNYTDAQPLRYPSQVFGVETLVATSKATNEKGLKLDFENYEEANEANDGRLEFSDDEEKIEDNDGMNSIENTENTFEWDEAIACIVYDF